MLKSFKNKRPITFVSLSIYVTLMVFIIIESCLSSSVSGGQSNLFASITAFFVNIFKGPQTVEVVKPSEIGGIDDSSFVGKGEDDIPNIVIGTTTRLIVTVNYPSKKKKDDVYDKEWTCTKTLGNSNDYALTVSDPTQVESSFNYTVRITTNNMGSDLYSIKFNFANKLDYEYKFHIVDLVKPSSNQYEARIAKEEININESVKIETKLVDPNGNRQDTYIRRYLDESKIDRSSSNTNVATIDEHGVILGKSEGTALITYGKYQFPITVKSTINALPTSLDAFISPQANSNPYSLDYDYIFNEDEEADDYSVLVKANISDKSVVWDVDESLCAKLAPYKYDNDGYPIYFDVEGNPAVRVAGYRKEGNFNLICKSVADPTLEETIPLCVIEPVASDMTLNITENVEINVNEQKTLSIKVIEPKNVTNKKINVTISDSTVIEVINNNTESVILKALKVGSCHVTVKSLSNDTVIKEFDISAKAKQAINDDNFSDFHAVIRKFLGHFLLFLIAGVFGAIFFITMFEDKKRYLIALPVVTGIGLFVAGLSELIQYFVPTRAGTWSDIGIDFAGYFVGVLACFAIAFIVSYFKNKKKKDPQE